MDTFNRFPTRKEIAPVYAIIVSLIYGWTIYKFNYNLPGWLYFLDLGEILTILAYSMVTNFLESAIVLLGVLAAGFVLPKKWFMDAFVARGAGLSILVLGLMMYIVDQFKSRDYYPAEIVRWSPIILVLISLVGYFIGRIDPVRKSLEFLADRAIIFLYISIPLSFISLIVVLLRLIY